VLFVCGVDWAIGDEDQCVIIICEVYEKGNKKLIRIVEHVNANPDRDSREATGDREET